MARTAAGGPLEFRSGEARVPLIELYTSEGCSSCPPAEGWLGRLKDDGGLWSEFAPIAFHVDYWDYLGWRDPVSSPEWSSRQRALAATWRRGEVYTPCFALNGREWQGWRSAARPPRDASEKPGALSSRSPDGRQWILEFVPASRPANSRFDAYLALLSCGLTSAVKTGENAGKRLPRNFAVVELAKATMEMEGSGKYRAALRLAGNRPATGERLAVTGWISLAGGFEEVQSVGGWLPDAHSP